MDAALEAAFDDDAVSAVNNENNNPNAENIKTMMVNKAKEQRTCCCYILKSMLNSDSQSIDAIVNNVVNKPQPISAKELYAASDVVNNSITVLEYFTKNHPPSNLPVQVIQKEFPSIVTAAKCYASLYSKIKSIHFQLQNINAYKCKICLK